MRTDFLFVGLNLNTTVQGKTPDRCTFYGWTTSIKIFENL